MRAALTALFLALSLAGCVSAGSYPSNPPTPSPSEQESDRSRELGASLEVPGLAA